MRNNEFSTVPCDGESWHSCEGEISHVVHRLRWRRKAAKARTVSLFAVLAIIAMGGSYIRSGLTREFTNEATGSPCETYREEIRAFYCDKTRVDLEPKIWEHISHCQDCGADFVFFGGISHHHRHPTKAQDGHVHDHSTNATTAALEALLKDVTLAVRQ